MRQDKKDVSKIKEIEQNRKSTVTNVFIHEKEDHLEVAQKPDNNVPTEEKAPLHCHN